MDLQVNHSCLLCIVQHLVCHCKLLRSMIVYLAVGCRLCSQLLAIHYLMEVSIALSRYPLLNWLMSIHWWELLGKKHRVRIMCVINHCNHTHFLLRSWNYKWYRLSNQQISIQVRLPHRFRRSHFLTQQYSHCSLEFVNRHRTHLVTKLFPKCGNSYAVCLLAN